ncbi:hypothetical protein EMPG_16234 [Blastomyces silverae]|uniref:Uncharacterized protein n=1 Tax=Blastomyces silverae TaxID=2060906 RepID=A0A0H1BB78_9EURO|nr:hypothetical protein EMPG_16234 [Blastomyces silverae]
MTSKGLLKAASPSVKRDSVGLVALSLSILRKASSAMHLFVVTFATSPELDILNMQYLQKETRQRRLDRLQEHCWRSSNVPRPRRSTGSHSFVEPIGPQPVALCFCMYLATTLRISPNLYEGQINEPATAFSRIARERMYAG